MTELLPTRIPGNPPPNADNRLVLVDDPDLGIIRVRWRMAENRWKCDHHGLMARADCLHAFAAAILLADEILGLNPNTPTEGTDNG